MASRLRPEYDPVIVRIGSFLVTPEIDESIGYNSNVYGVSGGQGSAVINTVGSASLNSNWSRNAFGAALTVNDFHYPQASPLDHTDWTVSLGGGITIGRHNLNIGYAHLSLNQQPTELGATVSETGTPFQVDDLRSDYSFGLGTLTLTPTIDDAIYRFGSRTVLGRSLSDRALDRNVATAGVTARYALSAQRGLLLTTQAVDSTYFHPQSGQPNPGSRSAILLAGLDYQSDAIWHYRVLVGLEVRSFLASAYATQVAPVAEASVIWTPTGLTTVTGTLSRFIEDVTSEGTGGATYTDAKLVIDHEYSRNFLLQARAELQAATYVIGGSQTNASIGASATWLLNRRLRLTASYTYTQQSAPSSTTTNAVPVPLSGGYDQSLATLTLRFVL